MPFILQNNSRYYSSNFKNLKLTIMIAENVMTTQDVANRMSELFKEYKWNEVQDELYSDDCESIEPAHAPGLKSVKGMEA